MFAGNIGTTQRVDTLIRAAVLTRDIQNLRWHIVGGGTELERCQMLANELSVSSVFFHGRKPVTEMTKYYAMADAMLITMKKESVLSMTLPGKVQSYMAAGKPIVGAIDGEAADVIKESNCGVCVPAETAVALADAVRKVIARNKFAQMGKMHENSTVRILIKAFCMEYI